MKKIIRFIRSMPTSKIYSRI